MDDSFDEPIAWTAELFRALRPITSRVQPEDDNTAASTLGHALPEIFLETAARPATPWGFRLHHRNRC